MCRSVVLLGRRMSQLVQSSLFSLPLSQRNRLPPTTASAPVGEVPRQQATRAQYMGKVTQSMNVQ
jgi:hypothetical protein